MLKQVASNLRQKAETFPPEDLRGSDYEKAMLLEAARRLDAELETSAIITG